MEGLVKGDVVVVSFPFSDLSASKRRPAFVVARLPGDDVILAQITSQPGVDLHRVVIESGDFDTGGLRSTSYVRAGRLFTCERSIVLYRAGHVTETKTAEVREAVVAAVTAD